MPSARLRVARDPALALVVRIFVGSMAERWDVPQPIREDLRLVASELFAGAVESGGGDVVTFEISSEEHGLELRTEEMHANGTAEPASLEGWTGRFALIRALFPNAEIGDAVRIRVPAVV